MSLYRQISFVYVTTNLPLILTFHVFYQAYRLFKLNCETLHFKIVALETQKVKIHVFLLSF